jgi:hypothetical protein
MHMCIRKANSATIKSQQQGIREQRWHSEFVLFSFSCHPSFRTNGPSVATANKCIMSCFRCCSLKIQMKLMMTTCSDSPYIALDNYTLVFANWVPFVFISSPYLISQQFWLANQLWLKKIACQYLVTGHIIKTSFGKQVRLHWKIMHTPWITCNFTNAY